MKNTIRWILLCAICSFITYRISFYYGFKHGYWNGVDTAIAENRLFESAADLSVLQKLQTNDVSFATHMLETNCFDAAHIFYEKPAHIEEARHWLSAKELLYYPDATTSKEIAQELSKYRASYRTNSAEWDVMERKLAVELTNIK